MVKKLGITLSICFTLFFTFAQTAYADDFQLRSGLESAIDITDVSIVFSDSSSDNYGNEGIDLFISNSNPSLLWDILMNVLIDSEVTFDRTRTITGNNVLPGTEIRFVALTKEEGFHFDRTLTVGPSGVFSMDVDLEVGYNIILVLVTSPIEYGDRSLASLIRRLPVEIRDLLSERTRNVIN
ncbi:MAG: hypothetical protein FWE02_06500 [Defluviitaleaceae bacterium]|nr:hypothetical protein [Defluviitaleaceae bacterium]